MTTLPEALRRRMQEQHLSVERVLDDVAQRGVDLSRHQLTYLISGDRRSIPPREILEPVAAAVGLDWDEVVELL